MRVQGVRGRYRRLGIRLWVNLINGLFEALFPGAIETAAPSSAALLLSDDWSGLEMRLVSGRSSGYERGIDDDIR